jgi:hypothetical protein
LDIDLLVNGTPIRTYEIGDHEVLVKREDLCCPAPGPSFSKMRGVVSHINNRNDEVIGVLDTLHSKAGWGVSWACNQLERQCVNFWPRYKKDPPTGLPRPQQREAEMLGSRMISFKAGRSSILYHAARKWLRENTGGYLMPNALKLPETIDETAAEVARTPLPACGTLVVSISSGTIAAGVLRGFHEVGLLDGYRVVLHMGYSRNPNAVHTYVKHMSGLERLDNIGYVDESYSYADKVDVSDCPFPTNPHYDGKAWQWLTHHINELQAPVVFWNIGD